MIDIACIDVRTRRVKKYKQTSTPQLCARNCEETRWLNFESYVCQSVSYQECGDPDVEQAGLNIAIHSKVYTLSRGATQTAATSHMRRRHSPPLIGSSCRS